MKTFKLVRIAIGTILYALAKLYTYFVLELRNPLYYIVTVPLFILFVVYSLKHEKGDE